jgi:hypothetical protein
MAGVVCLAQFLTTKGKGGVLVFEFLSCKFFRRLAPASNPSPDPALRDHLLPEGRGIFPGRRVPHASRQRPS